MEVLLKVSARLYWNIQSMMMIVDNYYLVPMDYAIPRAEDLINVDIRWNMVPCETNILQIKGAGEAGAIGAPPAIINALANVLNIEHINMPATPNNVWRELNKIAS